MQYTNKQKALKCLNILFIGHLSTEYNSEVYHNQPIQIRITPKQTNVFKKIADMLYHKKCYTT